MAQPFATPTAGPCDWSSSSLPGRQGAEDRRVERRQVVGVAAGDEIAVHHHFLIEDGGAGIAQIGALIPGVSRSGSTLTAALFLNFKREEAARFSFLLGLPAIALAGLKELWVLFHADLPAHAWPHLIFGLVVASVSAFFAIWGLMKFLERFSTWPFVIYRALLGVFLIVAVSTGLLT